jgi:menaquinone-dependent protoporphyrinogen oxidase
MTEPTRQPGRRISRRTFIKLAIVGGVAVSCSGLGIAATYEPKIDYPEASYGENSTGKPLLIAYASRAGSTAEVAVAIGKRLSQDGTPVEVHRVGQVSDPGAYRAVVVGSAVRMGKWLPEAVDFVDKHRAVLLQRPTAYFTCGVTLREDTPAKRSEMESVVEPVRQILEPVASGLFAGKMDYSRLSLLMRLLIQYVIKIPEGDFRSWAAIDAWTDTLRPLL